MEPEFEGLGQVFKKEAWNHGGSCDRGGSNIASSQR